MVETVVLLFQEVKSMEVRIPDQLRKKLEYLEPFVDLQDYDGEGSSWVTSTTSILIGLFKELTKELRSMGYFPTIIHYNNLDKIKDEDKLLWFLNELRDFLQDPNATFIFVGESLLHEVISGETRLRQIFQLPIDVQPLSYSEVEEIISGRINLLRIDDSKQVKLF